jgi:putative ABC transport system permease protein
MLISAPMLRLALRNISRQRVRTLMTLAAIVFGVVGIILSGGFVYDMFIQLGEALIHSQSGHLQLAKKGYFSEGSRSPDKYLIDAPEAEQARIRALPEVADAMLRLSFSGLLNNGKTDLPVVGEAIEPEEEARFGTHLVVAEGRQLNSKDRYGALVGQGLASSLKLRIGDRVTLLATTPDGAMNTSELEVVGTFQSFSKDYDARAIKISLAAGQELLNTRGANLVVVALKRTIDTASVAKSLATSSAPRLLEVKTWEELNDFYASTVTLYDRQFAVLQLIILVMVLLSVINTVNMSVFERVAEFGTMRALGNRSYTVLALIMTENLLLGLIGAAVGVLLGVLLALGISAIGIPMPPPPNADVGYIAHIRVVPAVLANAFAVGVLAASLAALIPALRVSRMPVVEALRQSV